MASDKAPAEYVEEALKSIEEGATSISLREKGLGSEDVNVLCKGLDGNRSVLHLDLGLNHIDDSGVENLCRTFLEGNNVVEKLELSSNKISDRGSLILAKTLAGNQSLHSLCLAGNELTDHGVSELLLCLKGNITLEEIRLFYNKKLTDGCVKAVVAFCRECPSIQKIDLRWTGVSTLGVQVVEDAIRNRGKAPLTFKSNKSLNEGNESVHTFDEADIPPEPAPVAVAATASQRKMKKEPSSSASKHSHSHHSHRGHHPDLDKPVVKHTPSKAKMHQQQLVESVVNVLGDIVEFIFHEIEHIKKGKITKNFIIFILAALLVLTIFISIVVFIFTR